MAACFLELVFFNEPILRYSAFNALLGDEALGAMLFKAVTVKKGIDTLYVPADWFNIAPGFDMAQLKNVFASGGAKYLLITNGRYVSDVPDEVFEGLIKNTKADVLMVQVDPSLAQGNEKIQRTQQGHIAGIRMLYRGDIQMAPPSNSWPQYVLLDEQAVAHLNYKIPACWDELCEKIDGLNTVSVVAGGNMVDFGKDGEFSRCMLNMTTNMNCDINKLPCRTVGKVLSGKNVEIDENTIIIGPAIIASGVRIDAGAMIANSIVGCGMNITANDVLRNKFKSKNGTVGIGGIAGAVHNETYRSWQSYSYAKFLKRIGDVVAATVVLVLFAPVMAVVSAIIKISSAGPVFFGDKRQGLHGYDFLCYKFRSMIVGADKIQRKLRKLNEVDGPQFKMADDPRVTRIGKFLRSTYLDELPQFWNVLTGKMSIVGPRPSPLAENSQCPQWRDARLSVRPGITGLWQVCRTRSQGADFQEWVYYDKLYVTKMGAVLDLWICWRTALYIFRAFLKQF